MLVLMGCTSISYSTFAVTNNPVGSKTGSAILYEPTRAGGQLGDGGILLAAQNGGITKIGIVEKIHTVKYFISPKLVLRYTDEVVVTGE
jgi:hypothetical protein